MVSKTVYKFILISDRMILTGMQEREASQMEVMARLAAMENSLHMEERKRNVRHEVRTIGKVSGQDYKLKLGIDRN